MNKSNDPTWLREPTRDEIMEVLSKVASVPTNGMAMVDVEAIEEAQEMLEAMRRRQAGETGA